MFTVLKLLVNLIVTIVRFAWASLRLDQKMEDIIVKSDVNIQKENLDVHITFDNYVFHFLVKS